MLDGQWRPERDGVEQGEDGRVGADAESERDDDRRGDERVPAKGAPRVAKVVEDHARVLLWSLSEDARQSLQPKEGAIPETIRIAIAIDEDQRQLTAVLVTKCGRIDREQCPERARAESFERRRCCRPHRSRPARQEAGGSSIAQQTLQAAGFC